VSDADLLRLWDSTHESGHICAVVAVGFEPGPASLNPDGRVYTGCAFFRTPRVDRELADLAKTRDWYWSWPGPLKARIEGEVIVSLAGDLAVDLFSYGEVTPADSNVVAVDIARRGLPPPTEAELEQVAAHSDDVEFPNDDRQVERLLKVAYPRDPVTAKAWKNYLVAETRALLLRYEERCRWLATALDAEGTLSAAAVAKLVHDDHL
jgi:hypothetical protein